MSFCKKYNTLIALIFLTVQLIAQNKSDYFKVYPVNDQQMPEWAKLMYESDPDVKEVSRSFRTYIDENGFEKTIHTQNYKHWIRLIEAHVNQDGFIRPETDEERKSRIAKIRSGINSNQKNNENWTPLGPFETYIQGTTEPYSLQVNVYSADIFTQEANIMICGTETGTVYYTSDKAMNWISISDHAEFIGGITAVKIHPENPERFYICSDDRIYETRDLGVSWIEILDMDGSGNEITFDPQDSEHMFCTSSSGLFESFDGGESWSKRYGFACFDIVYHPLDQSIVYMLRENLGLKRCEIYKSINNGTSWEVKESGWYTPQDQVNAIVHGGKIAVTAADPDRVYVCLIGDSKPGDNGWIGVYRSDDAGENWYLPAGQIGSPYQSTNTHPWNVAAYDSGYHQGFYNFDLEANQDDPDILWVGTIRLSESRDGGESFKSIGAANSIRLDNQHADIQDIEVVGNEIWVASDGGINYSPYYLNSSFSRKNGINGSDFWGFGSGWNEDILVGGKYHNGNAVFYQGYEHGIFHNVGGVEESTGYVHPMDSRKAYFNKYWAGGTETVVIPEKLGDPARYLGILPYIPNESYLEAWSSGFFFEPGYSNHILMGEGSKIWRSINGGNYFESVYDFGEERRVLEIKISRANPDIMYTVVGGPGYWDQSEIHKSADGGVSWTKTNNLSTSMWRVEIDINPENPDEIWACSISGQDSGKVFRSLNSGNTWDNMTSPVLDGHNIRDILFQAGSDGVVYAASRHTVFKFDPENKIWQNLNSGIPFALKGFELRPFYKEMKLRIASYGKGIWEIPMEDYSRPIAQPMTHEKEVYCSRDTIQFDCYSVLNHDGASWEWSFRPEPHFISNPGSRNPRVVFGEDGSYDVTLTVTDKQGNQDKNLNPGMINILNLCEMDGVPGLAAELSDQGDFIQTADFNKEITEFTMTAWVHPYGIQDEYSGIMINDGVAAGLNFKNSKNELGYHWPGGQWWWDSGLIVPQEQWSHVAMVVKPGSVTLYLNGEESVHTVNVDPLEITSFKIGSYQAWNGRNFRGMIDEVAIWERALSKEDIRKYRHLTKEDFVEDPSFLSYYQFNAPASKVLDRRSNYHANLSGGSHKIISNGPFGSGSSSVVTIVNQGTFEFPDQGVALTFDEGSLPDGDLWMNRIDHLPNILPNENPGPEAYWIMNNYGISQVFEAAKSISFTHEDFLPTSLEMNTPDKIEMFSRGVNSDSDDWFSICNAVNATDESFEFDESCQIRIESQFYFSSQDERTSVQTEIEGINKVPTLYPNPASMSDIVKVNNPLNESFDMRIYDQSGKLVFRTRINANNINKLNDLNLTKGMYMYRIQNERLLVPGILVIL